MRTVVALAALMALAACGSKEAKKPGDAAFQQVLPGSASDAMLPYDTATSAPPLDPRQYDAIEEDKGTGGKPRLSPAAGDAAPEAETAPDAVPT